MSKTEDGQAAIPKAGAPWSVLVIAVISVAEILALAGLMVAEAAADPDSIPASWGTYAFWLVAGLLVVLTALQLLRARAWARSVLITWHLIVLFSLITIGAGLAWAWWVLLGLAASAIAFLLFLAPASRAFIQDNRSDFLAD